VLDAVGLALLAAIEPLGVVAFIAVLGSGGGRRNTRWFIVGWVLCACVVALVTVLFSDSGGGGGGSTTVSSTGLLQIGLGVAALGYLAVRHRRGHAVAEQQQDPLAQADHLGPVGAASIAAAVQGWPVVAAAVTAVLKSATGTGAQTLGVAVVVLLSASTFVTAHVLAGRQPERTAAWLGALRAWIEAHRDRAIDVLLLGVGGYLIAHGLIVQLTA